MKARGTLGRTTVRRRRVAAAIAIGFGVVLAATGISAAGPGRGPDLPGKAFWSAVGGDLPARGGAAVDVRAEKLRAFTLDRSGLDGLLHSAPTAASKHALVVALPDPAGGFQRFELQRSQLMEPGLAEKHPEIQTF